jgi:hypothetical protein
VALDDHHAGDGCIAVAQRGEDRPRLAGVLACVDQQERGLDRQRMVEGGDGKGLVLEVGAQRVERGQCLRRGTIGKQQHHGHRDLLSVPGRHRRR